MQLKNTIVLAFAALFMAVSCISSDKSVGDNLIPGNQDLPVRTAEIALPVQLKSSQPLQSLSNTECVFGAIRTPEHGLAEFATAANICPNVNGWNFGKDLQVEEVYFLANVSQIFVPNDQLRGIPQNITIHRTRKLIDTTTVHNNNFTEADYDQEPINASEAVYFGGDSLKIHLKKSFAEEIFTATKEERDTLMRFARRFKGLMIKSSAPDEGVYGGRENFINYGTASVYMKVNFQPTWAEGLARKDTIFVLNFGTEMCLNLSSYESKANQTDAPGEVMNIEGAAGIKPFISKDDLKQAIDSWKRSEGLEEKTVIIARGALVFPFEMPENIDDLAKYPSTLYPCNRVYDSTYKANIFYPVMDVNIQGYSIGAINRSLGEYRMDIPSIIQDFVSKDASQLDELTHNLWVMPTKSKTDSYYGNTTYDVDLSTYFLGSVNGPQAENHPKLQIIYSVMED